MIPGAEGFIARLTETPRSFLKIHDFGGRKLKSADARKLTKTRGGDSLHTAQRFEDHNETIPKLTSYHTIACLSYHIHVNENLLLC